MFKSERKSALDMINMIKRTQTRREKPNKYSDVEVNQNVDDGTQS